MFSFVMTHHMIRERMSPVELLEREHNLHVSSIEFKEILFKKDFVSAFLTLLFIGKADLIY